MIGATKDEGAKYHRVVRVKISYRMFIYPGRLLQSCYPME